MSCYACQACPNEPVCSIQGFSFKQPTVIYAIKTKQQLRGMEHHLWIELNV